MGLSGIKNIINFNSLTRITMKKYYLVESGEEVKFGEILVLELTKEGKNSTIHKYMEVKFIPELVDILLEQGIIKEEDVENKEEEEDVTFEWEEDNSALGKLLQSMIMTNEDLEKKVEELEDRLTECEETIATLLDK